MASKKKKQSNELDDSKFWACTIILSFISSMGLICLAVFLGFKSLNGELLYFVTGAVYFVAGLIMFLIIHIEAAFYTFSKFMEGGKWRPLNSKYGRGGRCGSSKINMEKINNIVKGLGKLYIGALNNCSKLQSSGDKMVLIFPEFRFKNFSKTTDNLIDSCENFGYTRQAGPLIYDRPSSVVVRRIYILIKN